jgi:hypothetical protein
MALGTGCCCNAETIQALAITVSGSEKDGNPAELSERVKAAAEVALYHCLECYHEIVPAPEKEKEKPSETPQKPSEGPVAGGNGRILPVAYYAQVGQAPIADVIGNARQVLQASTSRNRQPAANYRTGERNLSQILSNTIQMPARKMKIFGVERPGPAAPPEPPPANSLSQAMRKRREAKAQERLASTVSPIANEAPEMPPAPSIQFKEVHTQANVAVSRSKPLAIEAPNESAPVQATFRPMATPVGQVEPTKDGGEPANQSWRTAEESRPMMPVNFGAPWRSGATQKEQKKATFPAHAPAAAPDRSPNQAALPVMPSMTRPIQAPVAGEPVAQGQWNAARTSYHTVPGGANTTPVFETPAQAPAAAMPPVQTNVSQSQWAPSATTYQPADGNASSADSTPTAAPSPTFAAPGNPPVDQSQWTSGSTSYHTVVPDAKARESAPADHRVSAGPDVSTSYHTMGASARPMNETSPHATSGYLGIGVKPKSDMGSHSRSRGMPSVPGLLIIFKDAQDASQRRWAVEMLSLVDWSNHDDVVPALLSAARTDSDRALRVQSMRCLTMRNVSSPAVISAFRDLQSDADPRVRQEAAQGLIRLNGGAASGVVPASHTSSKR